MKKQTLKKILAFCSTFLLCSCSSVNVLEKNNLKRVQAENISLNDTASFVEGEIINTNTGRTLGARLEYSTEYGISFYPIKRESDQYSQVVFTTGSNGSNFIYLTFDITNIVYNPYTPILLSFNMYNGAILSAISSTQLSLFNTLNNITDTTYSMYLNSYNNSFSNSSITLTNNSSIDYIENNYSTYINSEYFYNESTYYLTMKIDLQVSRTLALTNGVRTDFIKSLSISPITNDLSKEYENGYTDGLNIGLEQGKAQGEQSVIDTQYGGKTYQQIFNTGYNQGYNASVDSGSLVPQLFEGIINIPISALNGLMPLTFFDVSIIRIVITFLAFSIVLYLISWLMSAKG